MEKLLSEVPGIQKKELLEHSIEKSALASNGFAKFS